MKDTTRALPRQWQQQQSSNTQRHIALHYTTANSVTTTHAQLWSTTAATHTNIEPCITTTLLTTTTYTKPSYTARAHTLTTNATWITTTHLHIQWPYSILQETQRAFKMRTTTTTAQPPKTTMTTPTALHYYTETYIAAHSKSNASGRRWHLHFLHLVCSCNRRTSLCNGEKTCGRLHQGGCRDGGSDQQEGWREVKRQTPSQRARK